MSEKNIHEPEKIYDYKGSLFLSLAWLIWSVCGFGYLVFYSVAESIFMEVVYLISAIVAANSLNNRKYGFNNSIRFYDDHIVLPKIMGGWSWKEEKIFYTDIDEVNIVDYGNSISKNFFEIEVRTDLVSYPIFGKKLSFSELREIYNNLCEKARIRKLNFPEINELLETIDDKTSLDHQHSKWKGYLALIALIVSGWTILGISLSTPYSNLLNGGKIFLSSFLISILSTIYLSRKFNKNSSSSNAKKWQKIFLLGYIGLYGGIALTFSFVFINGKLDSSGSENLHMRIVSADSTNSKKGPCFHLNVSKAGRMPSSTEETIMKYGDLHICSNALKGANVGDEYILKAKNGFLAEKWISEIAKK